MLRNSGEGKTPPLRTYALPWNLHLQTGEIKQKLEREVQSHQKKQIRGLPMLLISFIDN